VSIAFHWRLVQGDEVARDEVGPERVAAGAGTPRIREMTHFCRLAEHAGIDALLVDINQGKPDPLTMALALARETSAINFMVAHRPGLEAPDLFLGRAATFTALVGDRLAFNLVAGHSPAEMRAFGDHLDHDDRYRRMDEFAGILDSCYRNEGRFTYTGDFYDIAGRLSQPFGSPVVRPRIFLGGSSASAREVAARRADVWMRFPDVPERLARETAPFRRRGVAVGLRMAVIARADRREALDYGHHLIETETLARAKQGAEASFVHQSDSRSIKQAYAIADEPWLTPTIWLEPVRTWGATNMTLLGSYDEVADTILDLEGAGITHYILSGWPKQDEMVRFGEEVVPRVREREARAARAAVTVPVGR